MADPLPAAPPDAARIARLAARLRSAADPRGLVRLDRFLEIALYTPDDGYYTQPRARLGRQGDFYTAPHLGGLFGRTLARRVQIEVERLGSPDDTLVVDLGSGDGALAADLVAALREYPDGAALPGRYVVVDRPGPLRDAALRRARTAADGSPITVRAAGSVAELGPFTGTVIANELLDALPVRAVRWEDGRWLEMGVEVTTDRPRFAPMGPVERMPGPALPSDVPEGTVLEMPIHAEALVREIGDHLTAGAVVIVDYGDDEANLVGARSGGTLTAARNHTSLPDPLDAPGSADLSTFVNFSRVRGAAARAGFRESAYEPMAQALGRWGLPEVLARAVRRAKDAEGEVRLRLEAKSLAFGFETFRVLELAPPA